MPDACKSDAQIEEVMHLSLQLGRLLLANGADTAEVQTAVTRFAAAFGCEARLLVTYEALVLTLLDTGRFRTKAGLHLPAMNVNMRAIEALNRIVDETVLGRLAITDLRSRLEKVESGPPSYARLAVIAGLGLTAASLAKLLGGDWSAFIAVFVAAACGTAVRQQLSRRRCNAFLIPFVAALISGVIGGLAVTVCGVGTPALCLIAPGMILVPGVPLINGIKDCISNHMTLGIGRLGFAGLVVLVIAFGLCAAAVVTGVRLSEDTGAWLPSIPADALFSALAVVGFVLLFNVPIRLCWACIICGIASHTLRSGLMQCGVGVVTGTLLGSLAAGFLGVVLARRFRAPAAAFAFPGVVAMVPGSYAFRAILGALRILNAGANSSAPLIAETAAAAILTCLLAAAIAVGLAVPLAFNRTGRDLITDRE
jgi:uncharacterized membrane protein YjjP (DUF1212 family)